ncbi:MAG: hypothetical protein PUK40_05395 [Actinomycetaceae bacterium]|nr:hypothetical protein [Arcanobacterium sp.]MDD7505365.1 hypothetical protein [Actinomycetaceae bacterium]MDY6142750.1 hypothetical protein [Arcanobacterium sp.]
MFGKSKLPHYVRDLSDKKPLAATRAGYGSFTVWIAAWANELGIFPCADASTGVQPAGTPLDVESGDSGEVKRFDWSEFSFGSWDLDDLKLMLNFVDPSREPLAFTLFSDFSEQLVTMVRERVDRSVVYQQFVELPSGTNARGQVRRNRDEELFTEVVVDGDLTQEDLGVLDNLESELRDAVGLPQKSEGFRFA